MITKSPFKIYQELLSPLQCEDIIFELNATVPDVDSQGNNVPTLLHNDASEEFIFSKAQPHIDEICQHYEVQYKGSTEMTFEWYPHDTQGSPQCGNSVRIDDKWARVYDRDITAILFLSDYTEEHLEDWECYGGKLEFPQHHFGFNPQRGTLVLFPSVPNFINVVSEVYAGELYQVRWHIAAKSPFMYNPNKFPGNFTNWFQDVV